MAVERIVGIDFGTSTSVIRVKRYEDGKAVGERLETKEVIFGNGNAMVPTVIMKKDDDASICYFGYDAQQKKKKFTSYQGFKMDLESDDSDKRTRAKQLTEEFYAYLAKQYKSQSAGGHLGKADDKERTIISYPVKWRKETKEFMIHTAKKAGFVNVTGMDEAQAAIQAVTVMSADHLREHHLLKDGEGANILLIDMGAGTTDLVFVRYVPGDQPKTEVLNTWPKGGNIQFGGREIDELLRSFFKDKLDNDDADMLLGKIETDKFKSWKEEMVAPSLKMGDCVNDFEVLDTRAELMEVELDEYSLDREALEICLADYLKQFPMLIDGCLQNVGMRGEDVDLVIVTGGHGQWYFVNDMLLGKMPQFGNIYLPKIKEHPERIIPISRPQETVALGLTYSGLYFNASGANVETKKDVSPQEINMKAVNKAPDTEPKVQMLNKDAYMSKNDSSRVYPSKNKIFEKEEQKENDNLKKRLEEAGRKASMMQTDLRKIPYTSEDEFELVSKNGGYVIKKYIGNASIVSIPPMIRGRKVTEIGFCAFGSFSVALGNKTIEAVVVPNSVYIIGQRAFTGCSRLHTVIAHDKIEMIGESAFWGCDKLQKIDFGMGDTRPYHVICPPALKQIGASAFHKALWPNTYLKEVLLSRKTKVKNTIGVKTFSEKVCAVFYYD